MGLRRSLHIELMPRLRQLRLLLLRLLLLRLRLLRLLPSRGCRTCTSAPRSARIPEQVTVRGRARFRATARARVGVRASVGVKVRVGVWLAFLSSAVVTARCLPPRCAAAARHELAAFQ